MWYFRLMAPAQKTPCLEFNACGCHLGILPFIFESVFVSEGDGTTELAWSHLLPTPPGWVLPAPWPLCIPGREQPPRSASPSRGWGQDQHLPTLNPGTEGSPRRDSRWPWGRDDA